MIDNGEIRQDIIKRYFNKKHLITQDLDTRSNPSSAGVVHEFELDMENSTFDQSIVGIMRKNTLLVTEGDSGNFHDFWDINNMPTYTEFGAGVDINGGEYVYNQLYSTSMSGSNFQNEYSGPGAGYNIWDVDWKMFYDPSQNGRLPDGRDDPNSNLDYLYGCTSDCVGPRYSPIP